MRTAVGVAAIIHGGVYLAKSSPSIFGMWLVGLLAVLSGALLLIGLLTKFACVLVGLSSVGLSRVPSLSLNSLDTSLSLFLIVMISAALLLIGPGAFSLDSRLFGRREIIIPRNTRSLKI